MMDFIRGLRVLVILLSVICGYVFAEGEGTPENPYQISTKAQLEAVNNDLTACYILINDIDMSGETYEHAVIAPYDLDSTVFTGNFDGNGFSITNLTIESNETNEFVGLFGWIDAGGEVKNLIIEESSFEGYDYVGSLAGVNSGTITNCGANNVVNGDYFAGGLVGFNFSGSVTGCYSAGSVSGSQSIGGLIGGSEGAVSNSYSTGVVNCEDRDCGGLIGYNEDIVSCCYSSAIVNGGDTTGGLIGDNKGEVSDCYATGDVTGSNYVGGLAGSNSNSIMNSYSVGNVTGVTYVGGLAGFNSIYIINSYWNKETSNQITSYGGKPKSTVEMMDESIFIGWNNGNWTIDSGNAYPRLSWENSVGSVITTDYPVRTYTGSGSDNDPFVLLASADIICMSRRVCDWESSFVLGSDIDMSGEVYVPVIEFGGKLDGNRHVISNLAIDSEIIGNTSYLGLFGKLTGEVKNLGLENFEISGDRYIGALSALNEGDILNCYAVASITAVKYAGGLVAVNEGDITSCYSQSSITGESSCGGLTAMNYYKIENCYSTGSVAANDSVGGITSYNSWQVINCYSACVVNGGENAGGLIGYCGEYYNIVSCSFWDKETSGQETSTGGIGQTTQQMQTKSLYSGLHWDFTDYSTGKVGDWYMPQSGYPRLWWQDPVVAGNEIYVPDISGLSVDQIKAALVASGFTVGEVVYSGSIAYGEGEVMGLSVNENNTYLQPSAPVDIYVSAGLVGDGSIENPYQVSTALGFDRIGLFGCYILMRDIDFSGKVYSQALIGSDDYFTGRFNGNGFTLSNLTINSGETYVGLFGKVGTPAKIKNLVLKDCNITGSGYVGGLAGLCIGYISNCCSIGIVTGAYGYCGGLVGHDYDGDNSAGDIVDCYSSGIVTNYAGYAGGLIGNNDGNIVNCYSTCSFGTKEKNGGLVGKSGYSGSVIGSFWDVDVSGESISDGGIGKTTAQMHELTTFTDAGWEFTDYESGQISKWSMSQDSYPLLGWQDPVVASDGFRVPYISGFNLVQTQSALVDAGFTIGEVIYVPSFSVAEDSVIEVAINPDVIYINESPVVNIYVSTGGLGDGSGEDPYQIYTRTDLEAVNNDLAANYILMRDIDLSYKTYEKAVIAPGIKVFSTFSGVPFTGNFNGNGFLIDNLKIEYHKIEDTDTFYYVDYMSNIGLFGCVDDDGSIRNLALEGCGISGYSYVGTVAGYSSGSIINSHSTGIINGFDYVGGLTGVNEGVVYDSHFIGTGECESNAGGIAGRNCGEIVSCYSEGHFSGSLVGGLVGHNSIREISGLASKGSIDKSYSTANVSGEYDAGGLVGFNEGDLSQCYFTGEVCIKNAEYMEISVGGLVAVNSGVVANSYSTGAVSGYWYIGGLVGENRSNITNCYSIGMVTGDSSYIGGVVGKHSDSSGIIAGCLWDTETSGQIIGNWGIGKNTVEMQASSTFTDAGWDFVNESDNGAMEVWYMLDGEYPRLYWQADIGDCNYNGLIDAGDISVMSLDWLSCEIEGQRLLGDINADGVVSLEDLAVLASQW